MKRFISVIVLTLLVTCGSVYGNPAIEALKNEIQHLEENIDINDFERHWKLNQILEEMTLREKYRDILEQWEQEQINQPCESMFRLECENGVRI